MEHNQRGIEDSHINSDGSFWVLVSHNLSQQPDPKLKLMIDDKGFHVLEEISNGSTSGD